MQREGNLEPSQDLVAPSFLSRLSLEVGTQAFWGLWKIVPSNNCWKGGHGRFGTGPLSESEPCFGVALADTHRTRITHHPWHPLPVSLPCAFPGHLPRLKILPVSFLPTPSLPRMTKATAGVWGQESGSVRGTRKSSMLGAETWICCYPCDLGRSCLPRDSFSSYVRTGWARASVGPLLHAVLGSKSNFLCLGGPQSLCLGLVGFPSS